MEKLRDFQHTVTAVQQATLAPAPQAPLSAQEWEAVNSLRSPKGVLVSEPQGFTHRNLLAPHVASQHIPVCT